MEHKDDYSHDLVLEARKHIVGYTLERLNDVKSQHVKDPRGAQLMANSLAPLVADVRASPCSTPCMSEAILLVLHPSTWLHPL